MARNNQRDKSGNADRLAQGNIAARSTGHKGQTVGGGQLVRNPR
jgi:hypothetical protein